MLCVWGTQLSWSRGRGGGEGQGEDPEGQRESEETSSFEHVCDWQVYGLGKVRGILHNQVIFKNNLLLKSYTLLIAF